jgi:hypothetical protein
MTRDELIARYRESAKSFRLQDIEGNDITPEQAADRELARLAAKTASKTVTKETKTMSPPKKPASKIDLAARAVDVHVKAALRRARAEEGDGGEPCEFCNGTGKRKSQKQVEDDQRRDVDQRGQALAAVAREIAKRDGVAYPEALKRAGKERPDLLRVYQQR